jgi:hypothetical protein
MTVFGKPAILPPLRDRPASRLHELTDYFATGPGGEPFAASNWRLGFGGHDTCVDYLFGSTDHDLDGPSFETRMLESQFLFTVPNALKGRGSAVPDCSKPSVQNRPVSISWTSRVSQSVPRPMGLG